MRHVAALTLLSATDCLAEAYAESEDLLGMDGESGVPERIRTSDLRFRKPLLYPAELQGRGNAYSNAEV